MILTIGIGLRRARPTCVEHALLGRNLEHRRILVAGWNVAG